MNTHIHTTTAHPHYCKTHDREFYPHTCGHGTGCIDCDLERVVEAARAGLPEAVNGRLEKAAELVRAGNVYVNGTRAAVKSQSSERIYEVNAAGCQCKDAQHRAPKVAGKRACKHQIATWLKRKMDERQELQAPDALACSQRSTTNGRNDSTDRQFEPIPEKYCPICKKTTWRHRDGRCIHCGQTDEEARRGPRVQDWSWAR